jgi:hypothetical protein
MKRLGRYATWLASQLLDKDITVQVVRELGEYRSAAFGPDGTLYLSLNRLGHKFFDQPINDDVDELLIHEFGHVEGDNHLDHKYHKWLTRLAVKFKNLALNKPQELLRVQGK